MNLSTLNLDDSSNNSNILKWELGTQTLLNNVNVNLKIDGPDVLALPCCEVKFYYCLKVRIKDINCNVCEKIICYEPEDQNCACGKWINENVKISINTLTGEPTVKTLKCKDTLLITPNNSIDIKFPKFTCPGEKCDSSYKWTISGPIPQNGMGNPILGADFSSPGVYYVTSYVYCGGNLCDSCRIKIRVKGGGGQGCECRGWNGSFISYNGAGPSGNVQCNSTTPVAINAGTNYTFTAPSYNCYPSGVNCLVSYSWQVDGMPAGGTSGNPFTTSFTPGTHVVSVTANCGAKKCATCKFTVKVGQIEGCDCKGWADDKHQITIHGFNPGSTDEIEKNIECGKTYYSMIKGASIDLTANYLCSGTGCITGYRWDINPPAGPASTYNIQNIPNYVLFQSGI